MNLVEINEAKYLAISSKDFKSSFCKFIQSGATLVSKPSDLSSSSFILEVPCISIFVCSIATGLAQEFHSEMTGLKNI